MTKPFDPAAVREMLRHLDEYSSDSVYGFFIDAPPLLEQACVEIERLRAQVESLNLAANQYSESRDKWYRVARQLEADIKDIAATTIPVMKRIQDIEDIPDISALRHLVCIATAATTETEAEEQAQKGGTLEAVYLARAARRKAVKG
jgi:hypothetical protein